MGLTELEVLGMELKNELRMAFQELELKTSALEETTTQLNKFLSDLQITKDDLLKAQRSNEEYKASLSIRSEAIKKLEEQNSQLRDTVARIRVQNELYQMERQQLVQRCQTAEAEMNKMKMKIEGLEKREEHESGLREQCLQMQQHFKEVLNKTVEQHEELRKDHLRIEKDHQEAMLFIDKIRSFSELQVKKLELAEEYKVKLEQKLIKTYEEIDNLRNELENAKCSSALMMDSKTQSLFYLDEWTTYQKRMEERLRFLQEHNNRLVEEIALIRKEKGDC